MQSVHRTVLLNETIEGLHLGGTKTPIVVDATFGGGGHSLEVCRLYPSSKIIALDQDKGVFEKVQEKFEKLDKTKCDISLVNLNFRDMDKALEQEGVEKVDGIIFDLGLSSDQIENSGRGFSFIRDEPLLMTMKEDPRPEDLSASDVVNTWSEQSLANIIYGYGEERFSRKIAKAIVERRKVKPFSTTLELVEAIESGVPGAYKRGRLHFATKTFQAIRIAVNDELGTLKTGLEKGFAALGPGGRMSVISFHSLEDRIVKRFFREMERGGRGILINKKPIIASEQEIKNNPRARSAKLRLIVKR